MKTLRILLRISLFCCPFIANAQWVKTNGPGAGTVLGFAQNTDRLFLGINGAGVYVSTNDGLSWGYKDSGTCNALAANGDIVIGATTSASINMSFNGGNTFTYRDTNLGHTNARDALITGGSFFVATQGDGVIRSTDNGNTWARSNTGLGNLNVYALTLNGTTILAGTESGIYKSIDGGNNWSLFSLASKFVRAIKLRGTKIYAGINGEGILVSTNNGSSWTSITTDPDQLGLNCLAVDNGSTIMMGNAVDVFYSTNDGSTWSRANLGLTGSTIFSLMYRNGGFYAGTLRGALYTTDNWATWTSRNGGLPGEQVRAIGVKDEKIFVGGFSNGVRRSLDGGTTWSDVLGSEAGLVQAILISGNTVYAGGANGIYRSDNSGNTWTQKNSGFVPGSCSALAQHGSALFATSGAGIYRSANSGDTWTAVNTGLPGPSPLITTFHVIQNTVFAGTDDHHLYRTTDDGDHWQQAPGVIPNTVLSMTNNESTLFVTNDTRTYRSLDQGDTWEALNGSPASGSVYAANGIVFATGSCASCVFMSPDNGTTWKTVAGAPNDILRQLTSNSEYVFFGSSGSGVYKLPLFSITKTPDLVERGKMAEIEGFGFDPIAPNNIVKFSGVTATVASATPTLLVVFVPNVDNGQITVQKGTVTLTSPTPFKIKPRLDNFSPTFGPAGTIVTLIGTGFTQSAITFNGQAITPITSSRDNVTFAVPSDVKAGRIKVKVGTAEVTSLSDFYVTPSITAVVPLSGEVGALVAIYGNAFGPDHNDVFINDVKCPVFAIADSYILIFVPDGASTGKFKVSYNFASGISNDVFVVNHSVDNIQPVYGFVGSTVTINGQGLNDPGVEVKLNGVNAVVAEKSATQLKVIVPEGATDGVFSVTINGLVRESLQVFDVTEAVIKTISPAAARAGLKINVLGIFSRVLADNHFSIGGLPMEIVSGNENAITLKVPTGAVTGIISLTVFGHTVVSDNELKITDSNPLTVSSYEPSSGPVGTKVTIRGTGFSLTNTVVSINSFQAEKVSVTPEEIVVKIAPGTTSGVITLGVSDPGVFDAVPNIGDFTVTTVQLQDQVITFGEIADHTMGDAPFQVSATASSGLIATISSFTPLLASVVNNSVSLLAPGHASIAANQGGSSLYKPAPAVVRTFCINPATPVITLFNETTSNPEITALPTSGMVWFKDGVEIPGEHTRLGPTESGTYTLQIVVDGCKSQLSNKIVFNKPVPVTTGLEGDGHLAFKVYPNPAQKTLNIELPATGVSHRIFVMAIDGRITESRQTTESSISFDVSNYVPSVYMVYAESNGKISITRFVKN